MRLALGEILAGQHAVEISLEFRVTFINIQHLLNVAARYHSAFYAMLLQVADEVFEPCNIFILHGLFKLIQSGCNLSLFLLCACKTFDVGEDGFIGEILVVNLNQSLSFDAIFEIGHFRMILPAYHSPEDGVLRFCIEYHAIQIEECCFYHIFLSVFIYFCLNYIENGCKVTQKS